MDPSAKMLFLNQNPNADIERAALSNGAQGYVLKTDAGSELLPAIKAVLRDGKYVSSGIKWAESKAHPAESTRLSST